MSEIATKATKNSLFILVKNLSVVALIEAIYFKSITIMPNKKGIYCLFALRIL
jgi:uncharacterized membrane protein